ncbi:glycosyltransferase family 2 protein [Paraburkholderia saeva]|uniref:glycosyltransferase family 2 protein n=1 Tax=Paraburkholderia saeva TaxID=2777537 RepID=UPI001D2CDE57|nr:glycosyltransferase family 2 protein [Paraburkholderia saeva]CAG4900957.1 putative glycosyltransferase [Paraburkholderia saeva]
MKKPLLSLVVPFYNEEESIEQFFPRVGSALRSIESVDYEIVCINDGSKDATLLKLFEVARSDPKVHVVDLSRNFGKEAALTAGLNEALGDIVVPFDADLQDPPEVIAELVAKWQEGYDVVVAKRIDRASDTFLKRSSAAAFYRLHNKLSDVKIPENVGDFRLITREVVEALKLMPESRRFMKGLFAWVGYRTATVTYTRESRVAGKTKFSAWKLWNFALEGLTSFGTLPLRVWLYLGLAVAMLSLVYAGILVARTLILGIDVPGYASLITAILFLGGIQLIGIGIIGEYIGRIYVESKQRPIYLIRQKFRSSTPDKLDA